MNKISTITPGLMTYYKSYDSMIIIILIGLIFIPIILIIALITCTITEKSVKTQNLNRNTIPIDGIPANIDEKCKNYVYWVYLNRNIDPKYGLCDIKTMHDAYKWIVCMKPNNYPCIADPNIDCSQLYCRY